jgi:hypothetical protein
VEWEQLLLLLLLLVVGSPVRVGVFGRLALLQVDAPRFPRRCEQRATRLRSSRTAAAMFWLRFGLICGRQFRIIACNRRTSAYSFQHRLVCSIESCKESWLVFAELAVDDCSDGRRTITSCVKRARTNLANQSLLGGSRYSQSFCTVTVISCQHKHWFGLLQ